MKKFLIAAIWSPSALAGCSTHAHDGAGRGQVRGDRRRHRHHAGRDDQRRAPTSGVSGLAARAPCNPLKRSRTTSCPSAASTSTSTASSVEDEYKPHGRGARASTSPPTAARKVTLQGNTDERGSREYNIALGQKRADAVKRMMTLLGVQEVADRDGELRQGKAAERDGHDEAAWAENRRVDIVYVGE